MSASFIVGHHGGGRRSGDGTGARPVAGGTDLVVGARQGKAPLPEAIVAIDRIEALRDARRDRRRAASRRAHDPRGDRGERDSALDGSRRSRTRRRSSARTRRARNGTIGGNVMNASPAMDTGGALLCFGATVTLRSADGERSVSLDELWTGPGATIATAGRAARGGRPACAGRRARARPTSASSTAARWRSRSSAPPPCVTVGGRFGHRRPRRDHGARADDPSGRRGRARARRQPTAMRRRDRSRRLPRRPPAASADRRRPRLRRLPRRDGRGRRTTRDRGRARPGARRRRSRSLRATRSTAR